MADQIVDAFFVARVQPAAGGGASGVGERLLPCCKWTQPGRPVSSVAPSVEAAAAFCFPLGVEAIRPSAYLVTSEFSFTLTGGDGARVHGVCRRTADPTHVPPAGAGAEARRWPQVLCLLSRHPWRPFWGKVLEVVEQLLGQQGGGEVLAPDAPAALFLASLPRLLAAAGPPMPPLGAVVRVPLPYSGAPVSVDRMRRALAPPSGGDALLGLSADAIELEVPPDLGNGPANAGISLARLLWFLTPRQAVTLVASLLLERRVILVARDADTVSAAVHAANALLYPFRWQHIYLPLLPLALKDYLAAPMPYLVGLQADCLPLLRGLPLEETVMLDLDCLGSCTPPLGSPGDDYFLLPYARELEDVFEVVREHIQSPTKFDSTPKCTELLQDFFLRLVGGYRKFVRPDDGVTPAALALGIDRPMAAASFGGGANGGGSRAGSTNGRDPEDENPRAHGFLFDQAAFIAAHRRKAKVAAFLQQFRNSQMLEVFITERLALAAGGYATDDPFELKVADRAARQAGVVRIAGVPLPSAAASKGRIGSLLRKAGAAVKQGGRELVAAVKQAGGPTAAEDLQAAGRSNTWSGPNLTRHSPLPVAAGGMVAHSRGSSFSGSSRMGSRSSSYSNLSRPSANLAALNGGVQPSLEQLRPDMFFGADDDDDDSASVASEAHSEGGRPAAAARNTAAPLGAAMSSSRSFGVLFQHPASTSYSAPMLSLPPLVAGVGTGPVTQRPAQPPPEANSAAATRTPPKAGAAAVAGAADGAASKRAAASPALIDLESPAAEAARWRQKQAAYNHGGTTPQQLFSSAAAPPASSTDGAAAVGTATGGAAAAAAAAGMAAAAAAAAAGSQASRSGWATFGDTPPPAAPPAAADARSVGFGSPAALSPASASRSSGSPLQLEPTVGPLGSSALLAGLGLASTLTAAAAAGGAQQQQQPPQQQPAGGAQQHQASPPLSQQWQPQFQRTLSEQQRQEHALVYQQQQQQQQPQFQRTLSQQQQQQQQQPQFQRTLSQQQQQPPQFQRTLSQQQQTALPTAALGPPSVLLAGLSSGWATFGEPSVPAAQPQAGQPLPAPAVCRDSMHSPLAMGMTAVHRHTSSLGGSGSGSGLASAGSGLSSGGGAPASLRRGSSSGTGTASGGSFPQSPLSVTRDAFAEVAVLAAADASQHMALPHRRTSSQGGAGLGALPPQPPGPLQRHASLQPQHQQPIPPELARRVSSSAWRSSSTSSWAEFEAAPAAACATNPFLDPPQHSQQQQQEQLARQLTAGARATSWGDWSAALPSDNCWAKGQAAAGPAMAAPPPPAQPAPSAEFAHLRLQ